MNFRFLILTGILCFACTNNRSTPLVVPNILWIYLEDTSPLMSCYGETLISTPNIDYLAENGTLYSKAIMPAPVCSPCRSAIITGQMATSLGLHNHHSSRSAESAIYLPDGLKTIPELFRQAGYFTFNNGKDDYNFHYDRSKLYQQDYRLHALYGNSGVHLEFSEIADNQPFFGQIQLRGGKEVFSRQFEDRVKTPVDRDQIELPPYLPNHPVVVEEYANHLDAIQITDDRVGQIMAELKENGLLNNTIVFFFSDHGMRLTRHKQFLYEGGIHVPLIIADFTETSEVESGAKDDRLISGIDLGPTALSMAGIEIPDRMEGRDILDASLEREYVISARDRCDFTIDRIRSVRSGQFKYIRNFMTDRPFTQRTYMDVDSVDFVRVLKELNAQGELDAVQSVFFSSQRPSEELYDLHVDPYEINNLADHPDYQKDLRNHREILHQWMAETNDKGQYPESEEGLKFMLGIWGEHALNPEYQAIRAKYPDYEGSLWPLKSQQAKLIEI